MGLAVGAACIALAVFLPGIGTVAAGALLGAGMGAISASVAGAVSDYSSGNVRSLGEATKDMVISMITGAITGAIGAAFPSMKWFGEGLIDVGSGILTRGMYALLNPDMSTEEKLAYVFDLKQMGVDFITGVAMHFAFKGVSAEGRSCLGIRVVHILLEMLHLWILMIVFLGIFRNEQMLMPMDIMIL